MKLIFDHNSRSFPVDLTPSGKSYRAQIGDQTVEMEIIRSETGKLDLLVNGKRVTAYVSSDNAKRWVTVNGQTFVLTESPGARQSQPPRHGEGELTAPMPGQIRTVNVVEGETVAKGQTLLVLEAMKMEIRVHSPRQGVVKKLFVKQGQTVEREQILIEVESQTSKV